MDDGFDFMFRKNLSQNLTVADITLIKRYVSAGNVLQSRKDGGRRIAQIVQNHNIVTGLDE